MPVVPEHDSIARLAFASEPGPYVEGAAVVAAEVVAAAAATEVLTEPDGPAVLEDDGLRLGVPP